TLSCLAAMGARVERDADGIAGNVAIGGLSLDRVPDGVTLDCHESGSTLRFLIPMAMLSGRTVHFTGSERLMQRPLGVYEELSAKNGGVFRLEGRTLTVRGGLSAGEISVPGNISSQFITGLLLALSSASAPSRILVTDRFESSSYTDITVRVLRDFGRDVTRSDREFTVTPDAGALVRGSIAAGISAVKECGEAAGLTADRQYRQYAVEGDCSNAAFLEALAILAGDGALTVAGVPEDTAQGDRVYREMLRGLADGSMREFDLSDCPDLAPCMFAMAAFFGGAHFTGTARLAIKESDRARACAEELAKFGASLTVGPNDVTVSCEALHAPAEVLSGHNDHRIVMAMALLCTVTGGTIDGAEAVAKSYPDFFTVIAGAGIRLATEE
ncbi:MAG: hypothetical protein J5645_07690, partial [Lachnospiraceae bacterium]|nr:hypothetical protein [Lachnospiraceae bacterium]